MKNKRLNYHKLVLYKVSFEPNLFFKEYKKARKVLPANEINDLDNWLIESGLYDIVQKSSKDNFAGECLHSQKI